MSDENKPKTARSYSGSILSDNFILHINIRFLLNTFIVFGSIIYSFYSVMSRLESVERELESAAVEIKSLMDKHIAEEEIKIAQMQEQLEWYEKELSLELNPLNWGKKKRKKK
jgi:hypothetical protein